MSKQILVYCVHHMDLIWQNGWDRFHYVDETVVRPYVEREERQIHAWLKLIAEDNCSHSIEQTATLRMFLQKNPDLFPEIKALLDNGKLAIDGAGESVVDTNYVYGESLVRNHLYSIRWLQETFSYRPSAAIATDTFGMSAQIPQILNSVGYTALALPGRGIGNANVWKGLDSTEIYVKKLFAEPGTALVAKWHAFCQAVSCICNNEGCDCCAGYGGLHNGAQQKDPDKLRPLFEQAAAAEENTVVMYLCAEFQLPTPEFGKTMKTLAAEFGMGLRYVTLCDLQKLLPTPAYQRMLDGKTLETDRFPGVEGRPVVTGCYVSRIKLKQINRELENRLIAAETWCSFASLLGYKYPYKKFAWLWDLLAFTQFHDAVAGCHTDPCYEDLISAGNQIKHGVSLANEQALEVLGNSIHAPAKEGFHSFAVFNPLSWEVREKPLEVWISWPHADKYKSIDLFDMNESPVRLIDFSAYAKLGRARLLFSGAALPPVGYASFYYRPTETVAQPQEQAITSTESESFIENEYYRIPLTSTGLGAILDKKLGKEICRKGAGEMVAQEDYGSPWETLAKPYRDIGLGGNWISKVSIRTTDHYQEAIIHGAFSDPAISRDRHLHGVQWTQHVVLYRALPGIHFRIELTWQSENMRLMFKYPLGFTTKDDEAYYEIPFGILKRKSYEGEYGTHCNANGDYAAINSVTCVNEEENHSVTLCNRGIPAHRFKDGTLFISAVRSPQIPVYISNFKGARDCGPHVFEMVLYSQEGGLRESRMAHRGMEFNARFHATTVSEKGSRLPAQKSFVGNTMDTVLITAVKRSEDENGLIIRGCEYYGKAGTDTLSGLEFAKMAQTNLLEEETEGNQHELVYRPHEIKTIRLEPKTQ